MATPVARWQPTVAVMGEIGQAAGQKWRWRTGLAPVCGTVWSNPVGSDTAGSVRKGAAELSAGPARE